MKICRVEPFQFNHPVGVKISPNLTELEMVPFFNANPTHKPQNYRNGWIWYPLPAVVDKTREIGFRLGFENEVLRVVEVFDLDPDLYGANWDEWSKDKEEVRAQNTAHWLSAQGYLPGEHAWGTIWVGYDERSHCGGAVVRYESCC